MKPLLILAACLLGLPAFGQSTWRNFFTTNQNPIVEVVAGSNATVQASTVGVNLRRFTVNGAGSGGGQTNNTVVAGLTNVVVVTNSAAGVTTYSIGGVTDSNVVQILSTNISKTFAIHSLGFNFDGGGAVIQAGTRGLITIPYTGTIQSCTLMAYPSGSIEVRLWRTNSADASFPPTAAGAIGTNALTTDSYNIDATLTGWTTLVSSGDVFTVSIPTNALSITNLTMQLKIQP